MIGNNWGDELHLVLDLFILIRFVWFENHFVANNKVFRNVLEPGPYDECGQHYGNLLLNHFNRSQKTRSRKKNKTGPICKVGKPNPLGHFTNPLGWTN